MDKNFTQSCKSDMSIKSPKRFGFQKCKEVAVCVGSDQSSYTPLDCGVSQ